MALRLGFFLLVFANLVFFAWAQGYFGGADPNREPDRLNQQLQPEKLRLLAPEATVEIPLSEIAKREPSKISPMPTGLLNNLTKEEILDLLAYLESAGKAGAGNFKNGKEVGK